MDVTNFINGSKIYLQCNLANTINVKVSDEELAARREKWAPREPKVKTGYLARYASMVTSADKGAILKSGL